jgi:hypothetical protein
MRLAVFVEDHDLGSVTSEQGGYILISSVLSRRRSRRMWLSCALSAISRSPRQNRELPILVLLISLWRLPPAPEPTDARR